MLLAIALTCRLGAQLGPVQLARVEVRDAPDKSFTIGQKLELALSGAPGAEPLRVRIVRGTVEQLRSLAAGADDCIVVPSSVYDVDQNGRMISARMHFTPAWVGSEHGRIVDGRYLVFLENRNSGSETLRIVHTDWSDYLRHGYSFIVDAGALEDRPVPLAPRRSGTGTPVYGVSNASGQRSSPPPPCYRVAYNADSTMQLAQAVCSDTVDPQGG